METTYPLLLRQGMTIVVMFPKGVVSQPNTETKIVHFIEDNLPVIPAFCGLIILLVYYIAVWFGYSVEPKEGIIIPLFEPPDNLSPAAIRFISEMGFENKTYTIAFLSIAVKGHLKIVEDNGEFSLIKISIPKIILSKDELRLLEKLEFDPVKSDGILKQIIELKQKNHATIRSSINELKKVLMNNYEKVFFITIRRYFFIGLLITLITVIGFGAFGNSE